MADKFTWENGDIAPTVGSSVTFQFKGKEWSGLVIRELPNARAGSRFVIIPINEERLKKPEGPFNQKVKGFGGYVAIVHGKELTLGGDF